MMDYTNGRWLHIAWLNVNSVLLTAGKPRWCKNTRLSSFVFLQLVSTGGDSWGRLFYLALSYTLSYRLQWGENSTVVQRRLNRCNEIIHRATRLVIMRRSLISLLEYSV